MVSAQMVLAHLGACDQGMAVNPVYAVSGMRPCFYSTTTRALRQGRGVMCPHFGYGKAAEPML